LDLYAVSVLVFPFLYGYVTIWLIGSYEGWWGCPPY